MEKLNKLLENKISDSLRASLIVIQAIFGMRKGIPLEESLTGIPNLDHGELQTLLIVLSQISSETQILYPDIPYLDTLLKYLSQKFMTNPKTFEDFKSDEALDEMFIVSIVQDNELYDRCVFPYFVEGQSNEFREVNIRTWISHIRKNASVYFVSSGLVRNMKPIESSSKGSTNIDFVTPADLQECWREECDESVTSDYITTKFEKKLFSLLYKYVVSKPYEKRVTSQKCNKDFLVQLGRVSTVMYHKLKMALERQGINIESLLEEQALEIKYIELFCELSLEGGDTSDMLRYKIMEIFKKNFFDENIISAQHLFPKKD